MNHRLDYASPPAPPPLLKLRLAVPLAGVLFAGGSAMAASFIWRRAFDHSPGGGRFEETVLLEFAFALGGSVCGSIGLFVGLRHRYAVTALLGLLAIAVSLATLWVCPATPFPATYPSP